MSRYINQYITNNSTFVDGYINLSNVQGHLTNTLAFRQKDDPHDLNYFYPTDYGRFYTIPIMDERRFLKDLLINSIDVKIALTFPTVEGSYQDRELFRFPGLDPNNKQNFIESQRYRFNDHNNQNEFGGTEILFPDGGMNGAFNLTSSDLNNPSYKILPNKVVGPTGYEYNISSITTSNSTNYKVPAYEEPLLIANPTSKDKANTTTGKMVLTIPDSSRNRFNRFRISGFLDPEFEDTFIPDENGGLSHYKKPLVHYGMQPFNIENKFDNYDLQQPIFAEIFVLGVSKDDFIALSTYTYPGYEPTGNQLNVDSETRFNLYKYLPNLYRTEDTPFDMTHTSKYALYRRVTLGLRTHSTVDISLGNLILPRNKLLCLVVRLWYSEAAAFNYRLDTLSANDPDFVKSHLYKNSLHSVNIAATVKVRAKFPSDNFVVRERTQQSN